LVAVVAFSKDEAASPPLRLKRRLRERAAAFALSVLVHGAILTLVLGSLAGGRLEGGAGAPVGDPGVIYISLAGLKGAAPQSAPTQQQALMALYARIRDQQSNLPTTDTPKPVPGDVAKLFDVVQPAAPASDPNVGREGRGAVDQGGRSATPSPNAFAQADATAKQHGVRRAIGPGRDADQGPLWSQVEPCWDKLPNLSAVPVTLEVSLNDKGQIAVPPKIIRPTTEAAGQMRLIAEARALAAVSACVPYRVAAGAPRTIRVDFRASSGG
jgi:hypothetical protein